MVDAGQHELQRTPLGADDEVDALGFPREPLLELARKQDDERDRRDPHGEQGHVQHGGEGPAARVREREADDVHATGSTVGPPSGGSWCSAAHDPAEAGPTRRVDPGCLIG